MEEDLEESFVNYNVVDTLSYFKFYLRANKLPHETETEQLEAGDANPQFVLSIAHSQYTDVDAVGLQVWSGALLLSDYIIHEGNSLFSGANILELSSGTGFVSIIASIFGKLVMSTDLDEKNILPTIQTNFDHNTSLVKATYRIQELNFFKQFSADVANFVRETDIVVVSEIIYDNEITDGFIETLTKIFDHRPSVRIYTTVEKRFVFTLANLKVEAVHYDYFFHKINELQLAWNLKQLDIDFPQYFYEYDRSKELELWRISLD